MAILISIIARAMIGFLFVFAAISNLINRVYLIKLMQERGLPLPSLVFWAGVVLSLFGGLGVIFNLYLVENVFILIFFIIAATFIFHNFWDMEGEAHRIHLLEFVTNINMIGGLLLVLVVNRAIT